MEKPKPSLITTDNEESLPTLFVILSTVITKSQKDALQKCGVHRRPPPAVRGGLWVPSPACAVLVDVRFPDRSVAQLGQWTRGHDRVQLNGTLTERVQELLERVFQIVE